MRTLSRTLPYLALVALVAYPSAADAATMTKETLFTNTAEANFITSVGCDDTVVGVNVVQKTDLAHKDAAPQPAILLVFASFLNVCDIGSSWSFSGTTTLSDTEFVQDGVSSAHLVKRLNVAGNDVALDLTWTGVGGGGGERIRVNDKGSDSHVMETWVTTNQNAAMSGIFDINGLGEIEGNSLVNAQLETVTLTSKTLVK